MLDKIIQIIDKLEPLLLVVMPALFGLYLKLEVKMIKNKKELEKRKKIKAKQELLDWRHENSIKMIRKLKEFCNFYCDTGYVNTSYIQLENGTIATNKLSNMFFSCVAENSRYSNNLKFVDKIQRVPFARLSEWFNYIYESEEQVIFIDNKEKLDDIFLDNKVCLLVSCLVKNSERLTIGVCNFAFLNTDKNIYLNRDEIREHMLKFVSSIETLFLDFNIELENKKQELNIVCEEID